MCNRGKTIVKLVLEGVMRYESYSLETKAWFQNTTFGEMCCERILESYTCHVKFVNTPKRYTINFLVSTTIALERWSSQEMPPILRPTIIQCRLIKHICDGCPALWCLLNIAHPSGQWCRLDGRLNVNDIRTLDRVRSP